MSEATTLAGMLKSVVDGPAWHGSSVMETIEAMSAEQARRKPLKGMHGVWELALHMIAWQEYAIRVVDGSRETPLEGEADWPKLPDPPTDAAWDTAKRKLEGGMRELRERVIHLDEPRMRERVPGRDFPLKVLLHGLVHHHVYHVGQMALLTKA